MAFSTSKTAAKYFRQCKAHGGGGHMDPKEPQEPDDDDDDDDNGDENPE